MAKDLIFKTDGTFDFGDSKSLSTRFNLAELKMGGRVGFKRGKSEALLIRDKAANALKKVIDAGDFLEFRKLAEEIDVPATTLRRVYDELFAGQGVIKRTRDANKIIDKIIQTGETNPDKIKKIAKETYKVNIGDRAIKTATNMATDLSLAEYEDIFRKMAADRTYEPPIDISAKGKGLTANYIKAKANVKNEIPNLQTLLNQNISKRKKIKEMKKIADDPDLKTKYLVKKQMIRDKKRFLEAGKIGLSKADLALNSNQRTLIKSANELINSNPDALLKDKNLLNKISWRVDGNGNLYQSKPDLSAVLDPKSDSRFFHLSHSRRAGLGTQLTDAPVNRFATTFNFNNEFIKDAENFIEKNPDHPNVTKILKKAKELKITLRPNVPLGTFKNASGNSVRYVGYTQNINKPIEKIKTVIDEFMPKSLLKEWKPVAKKTIKNVAGKFLYPAMAVNQMAFGDKYKTWDGPGILSDFPLTPGEDVKQTNELLGMIGDKLNMAEGGSVEPRIPYRDGTSVAPNPPQEKSWEDTTAEWDKTLSAGGFNNDKPMYQKFGDMVDAESLALYYPALLNEAGLNVADFATRLPKVAKYIFEDVLTTPVGTNINSIDTDNSGIHKAWTEITRPYEWSKKVPYGYGEDGIVTLDDLIKNREAKMKADGKSDWPVIAGKNIQLGAELVAPIFPGLKAATSVAKSLKNSGTQFLDGIMSQKGMNTNVIDEALTAKGMGRRDFNKIVATSGLLVALKAAGLSDVFKVTPIKPTTAGIKVLRETSTNMPAWFPQFIDKISAKMIYEGDGISKYVGTADELPGVVVTKNGENWTVGGKNEYGQDFELNYEAPGYIDVGAEGGSPVFYKGDFTANDTVPQGFGRMEDVDYDGALLEEVDDVLGGTRQLEEFATGKEVKTPTRGENRATEAEMKADHDADMYQEQQEPGYWDE